jgi:hypothetical protein
MSGKRRALFVTTWLALLLLSYLMVVTAILFNVSWLYLPTLNLTGSPSWLLLLALVVAFAQAVAVLALFSWQRWGFVGLCVTAALSLVPISIALGLVGLFCKLLEQALLIGVLYWLLKRGHEDSAWAQLEPRRENT